MRVIAGEARRHILKVPEGNSVRPTTDRTKETLFNIINSYIYGCEFLDIFSGSGAIGIEALSRGAKKAYFVENDNNTLKCIEYNLNHTKLIEKAEILKYDYSNALDILKSKSIKFDVIFLDPPYNKGLEEMVISKIINLDLLNDGGIIVCESDIKTEFNFLNSIENYNIFKTKEFKTNKFTFITP
jgi:16S rRNA (guanine(966)-N(2))-methyltransferase RsmD